ncbi:MAG TPA: amidohydrolase [Thermoanaerobaculia bacterium]|nr:amidohydrolase [Thermoanaerobaculia bacterium]
MRILLAFLLALPLFAQSIDDRISKELPSLVDTYKTLHTSPELSTQEAKSSALVASELRKLGFEVTERVGKYSDTDATCYGVVAVMKNGKGPALAIRSDMDALPVEEQTGLPYASANKGVMHACGHDIHMTTLIGTARVLSQLKDKWHGTLMLIGQPAEEVVKGASAMLSDGLYERFPKPDFVIAVHDNASLAAGTIGYTPGYLMASADSVNLTIRGVGGHGASPEKTKDPVVMAAETVLALQTLVSRENSPLDPVVVTVGSIHGGTKRNIIPDSVQLLMTIRTYKPEVRKRVLDGIQRVARGVAIANGLPDDKMPVFEWLKAESIGATYNDPALTERLATAVSKEIGASNVMKIDPLMVSEDFSLYSLDHKIPSVMLNVGAVDPLKVASGEPLPSLHSSKFAPLPEATIRTGVRAVVASALDVLR